jgi:hypothetical protein
MKQNELNGTGQYTRNDATLNTMQSNLDTLYMLANRISAPSTLAILGKRIDALNAEIAAHVSKHNHQVAH